MLSLTTCDLFHFLLGPRIWTDIFCTYICSTWHISPKLNRVSWVAEDSKCQIILAAGEIPSNRSSAHVSSFVCEKSSFECHCHLKYKRHHVPRVSFVGVGSALVPFMGIIFVFSRTDTLTVIVRVKATRKRPVTCCRVPKNGRREPQTIFLSPRHMREKKLLIHSGRGFVSQLPSFSYAPVSGMKCTKNRLKIREAKSAETKKRNVRWFSTSHIVTRKWPFAEPDTEHFFWRLRISFFFFLEGPRKRFLR